MEYYSAIKKEKTNAICSNMDGTRDSHTKLSQKEKGKYHMISHTWNLTYGTNEPFHRKKKLMDLENGLMVSKREEEGVGWTGSLGLIDANYCIWSR